MIGTIRHRFVVILTAALILAPAVLAEVKTENGYVQQNETPVRLDRITGTFGGEGDVDDSPSSPGYDVSGLYGFHLGKGKAIDAREQQKSQENLLRFNFVFWMEGKELEDAKKRKESFSWTVKVRSSLVDKVAEQHTKEWSGPVGPPKFAANCGIAVSDAAEGPDGGNVCNWTGFSAEFVQSATQGKVDQSWNAGNGDRWEPQHQSTWRELRCEYDPNQPEPSVLWVSAKVAVTFDAQATEIEVAGATFLRARAKLQASVQ